MNKKALNLHRIFEVQNLKITVQTEVRYLLKGEEEAQRLALLGSVVAFDAADKWWLDRENQIMEAWANELIHIGAQKIKDQKEKVTNVRLN